jgi:zinc and cadmium transporter
MPPFLQALVATFAVSVLALIGIVLLFARRPSERLDLALLSFAAGILLATAFLELIPEAVTRHQGETNVFIASLAAMIGFFLLEWYLHGFHSHSDEPHTHHLATSGWFVLIGDGLHNFIDGIAIAASFAVSSELGVATTLAVAVHEIPQELADFGILVANGFTRERALLLNFLSGLSAVVGAVLFYAAGPLVLTHLSWFMAATAGMFIYIGGADLIPQLHRHRGLSRWTQVPFLVGALLIALLTMEHG